MPKTQVEAREEGRAGYFIGFALFFPALVLIYLVFAGANWLFFGSLS